MRRRAALLLCVLIPLSACTAMWARATSARVADDLAAMKAYTGRLVEHGLSDGEVEVKAVKRVTYRKPWWIKVEVQEPTSYAGEVFIYNGETVVLYSPRELLGVRYRNLPKSDDIQVRNHIERLTRQNLEVYTFSLRGTEHVAGERTDRWTVRPNRKRPWRMVHNSWVHKATSLPMKMEFFTEAGDLWYGMEFEDIDFDANVDEGAFSFTFPDNAVVLEWDLAADGISQQEAARTMNFEVMYPGWLPKGHEVGKLIRADHCLPMLMTVMSNEGAWLTLTQSRHMGWGERPPLGKEVKLDDGVAYMSLLSTFTSITWVRDRTQLTLTGNLAFPDMIRVADAVE